MAEGGEQTFVYEQVSSVVLTAFSSLEAVASSSKTLLNHPDVGTVFFSVGFLELLNLDGFSFLTLIDQRHYNSGRFLLTRIVS